MTTAQDQQSRAECRKAFEFDLIDNWMYTPSDFERNEVCMYLDDELEFAWECAWASWQAARALPAGIKPVGYLIDWPDEPDLGHYFAEGASTTGRSQPLHTAAQVQAMGRVPPGWQPVPVEPTGEMLLAIMSSGEVDVLRETPEKHQVLLIDRAGIPDRYTALLAAAPRPPAAQEGA